MLSWHSVWRVSRICAMSFKRDLYLSRKPLAGYLAIGLAWASYFAVMPVIKAGNVGASDGQYGMAILVSSFGALAAMWLAPFCLRVFGGLAISVGILVVALGMFSSGQSHMLWMLVLGMTLAAVGSGVVDVLVNAKVCEVEAETGRALMNLNHALYSFAYAAGALATGVLREAEASTLTIFGLLAGALILLAVAAIDRAPQLEEEPADATAPGMPYMVVLLVGLIVMVAFLAEAATEGWSALHLERTLGGSPGEGALGPALMGLTMGIGRLSGHWLARLMRDTTLMLIAALFSACGLVLAGLAPSVIWALIGFALAGLGISVVAPLAFALLGRIVPKQHRLAAISRASVLGYGAFFVGPPLMGLVAEGFGLRTAFVVIALILASTAVVLLPALVRRMR